MPWQPPAGVGRRLSDGLAAERRALGRQEWLATDPTRAGSVETRGGLVRASIDESVVGAEGLVLEVELPLTAGVSWHVTAAVGAGLSSTPHHLVIRGGDADDTRDAFGGVLIPVKAPSISAIITPTMGAPAVVAIQVGSTDDPYTGAVTVRANAHQ